MSQMVDVPVVADFNHTRPIGRLQIREDVLRAEPDWHLALGYRLEESGQYQVICVSVVPDSKFKHYEAERVSNVEVNGDGCMCDP